MTIKYLLATVCSAFALAGCGDPSTSTATAPAAGRNPESPIAEVAPVDNSIVQVQLFHPTLRDAIEHRRGSGSVEASTHLAAALSQLSTTAQRERLQATLNDPNTTILSYRNRVVADHISAIYRARVLDGAAEALENSRQAARDRSVRVTIALSDDAQYSASAGTIVRPAGGDGRALVILHIDATSGDVAMAIGTLQHLRRIAGDLVQTSQRVAVTSNVTGPLPARFDSLYTDYLRAIRISAPRNVRGVGSVHAIDIRLPAVQPTPGT